MENLTAYHVYYQNDDFGKFYEIDLLVQLASALFWKEKYGPIKLYCNKKFLNTLKEYNLDQCYDEINTTLMESIPYKEYLPKYWSFCKIYLAKYISQFEDRFVILDTDLWIREDIGLDFTNDLINYHKEIFYPEQKPLSYLPPETFLPQYQISPYNWDILPANGAFIYLNNKDLINKWYKWVIDIIEYNKNNPKYPNSADTVFIEQRILPVLAEKLGLRTGVVFNSLYKTWISDSHTLEEWEPKLDSTEELSYLMDNCKHIWGIKTNYRFKDYRDLVLYVVMEHLSEEFDMKIIESKYKKLFKTCYNIWNNTEHSDD